MEMNTDIKVQALLEKVAEKKAAVKRAEKPSWQTNCSFRWEGNETTNLQTVSDPEVLVRMLAFMIIKHESFERAAKELGLTGISFDWHGASLTDWTNDIKTRLAMINVAKTKKELSILEEKLNGLISPELRKQRELDEIEKLLAD